MTTFTTRGRAALAVLSAIGVLIMAYLTTRHFATSSSSLCNFGARFSCDLVNKSTFSAIFGVPLSVLGIGYFLTIAALALQKKFSALVPLVLATVFSLTFGAYLSFVELHLLGSVCLFCEASKALMAIILATAYASAVREAKRPKLSWIAATIAIAAFVSYSAYSLGIG